MSNFNKQEFRQYFRTLDTTGKQEMLEELTNLVSNTFSKDVDLRDELLSNLFREQTESICRSIVAECLSTRYYPRYNAFEIYDQLNYDGVIDDLKTDINEYLIYRADNVQPYEYWSKETPETRIKDILHKHWEPISKYAENIIENQVDRY